MTIKPFFAWYDLWVGAFWSKSTRTLYLMPVPMLGLRVAFGPKRSVRYVMRREMGGTRPTMVRTALPPDPRNPWPGIAIGLLLVVVALLALASIAMMIGGPNV